MGQTDPHLFRWFLDSPIMYVYFFFFYGTAVTEVEGKNLTGAELSLGSLASFHCLNTYVSE